MDNRYNSLYRCAFCSLPPTAQETEEINGLYAELGAQKIRETVKKRKFLPFVANLLIEIGHRNEGWEEIRDFYSDRNAGVIRALDRLFGVFTAHGADRIVVVENFGAFLAAGADPMWRFGSGDVDLYADIAQKDLIYKAAESAGYVLKERYSGNNLISTSLENKEDLPENFYFDIGWYPTARLKIPFLVYKEEAVDWANTVTFKDTRIRLPDKESLLYICMLHISVHNFSRQPGIRLYIDIQNSVKNADMDWEKIIAWAKRDGYTNRISTVAFLTRELIGTDIPLKVIHLCDTDNHKKLIRFVYDQKNRTLISKPGGLDSLKIEMYAHDRSAWKGLMEILFPSRRWLRQTYGKILPVAYIKYLSRLIK